jgi:hypothetical protein
MHLLIANKLYCSWLLMRAVALNGAISADKSPLGAPWPGNVLDCQSIALRSIFAGREGLSLLSSAARPSPGIYQLDRNTREISDVAGRDRNAPGHGNPSNL